MSREKEFINALVALSDGEQRTIEIGDVLTWIDNNSRRGTNEHWDVLARQVIRTLEEVGLVERGPHNRIFLTDAFFDSAPVKLARANRQEFDNQRRPPRQPPPPPGDGGPNEPGDGGPEEPGDLGGGGFREVLAHPFLFSLSEVDFNELLDAI